MNKIPNDILITIFNYDDTYHLKYKLCMTELHSFKRKYYKKDPEIICINSYYNIYDTIYSINNDDIYDYNKFILNCLRCS